MRKYSDSKYSSAGEARETVKRHMHFGVSNVIIAACCMQWYNALQYK